MHTVHACYHKTDVEVTEVISEEGPKLVTELVKQGAKDKLTDDVKM